MNPDRLLALYNKVAEAPDAIARVRRFVLDLAVRGKLEAQNPADEPAVSALKRIKAAGTPDGAFPLPRTWIWVDLDAVADTRLGKMLDKAKNKGTPRPYLRNVNVCWFDFDLSDLFEMAFEDSELDPSQGQVSSISPGRDFALTAFPSRPSPSSGGLWRRWRS